MRVGFNAQPAAGRGGKHPALLLAVMRQTEQVRQTRHIWTHNGGAQGYEINYDITGLGLHTCARARETARAAASEASCASFTCATLEASLCRYSSVVERKRDMTS